MIVGKYKSLIWHITRKLRREWSSLRSLPFGFDLQAAKEAYRNNMNDIATGFPTDGIPYLCAKLVANRAESLFSPRLRLVRSKRPVTLKDIIVDTEVPTYIWSDWVTIAKWVNHDQNRTFVAPFGETIALIDQLLGFERDGRWYWLYEHKDLRAHFWKELFDWIDRSTLSWERYDAIFAARCAALIVRYGTEEGREGMAPDAAYRCLSVMLGEVCTEMYGENGEKLVKIRRT